MNCDKRHIKYLSVSLYSILSEEEPTARRGCPTQGGATLSLEIHYGTDSGQISRKSPGDQPGNASLIRHILTKGTEPAAGDCPTIPAAQSIPSEQIVIADRPAPLTRPRRRFRMERYEITIISLMLGCGALCLYRLIWAIQP